MSEDRVLLVEKAKLARQLSFWKEMAEAMKTVTEIGIELSNEERNLLSVAYKNLIGSRRSSWRIITDIQKAYGNAQKMIICEDYREKIEKELMNCCNELLELLDQYLIPTSNDYRAFYLKERATLLSILAEICSTEEKIAHIESTEESFQEAQIAAVLTLAATHPIRLGLVDNFSYFYERIANAPVKAQAVLKMGLEAAGDTTDLDHKLKQRLEILADRLDRLRQSTSTTLNDTNPGPSN